MQKRGFIRHIIQGIVVVHVKYYYLWLNSLRMTGGIFFLIFLKTETFYLTKRAEK